MFPPRRWGSARLQWGHGDEAVEEFRTPEMQVGPLFMLQWGHGDEAVEEQQFHHDFDRDEYASMGPRR